MNRKEFITKDAELKYLRERVSYLELENENLRLKLKLAEIEKPRPEEKKGKYVFVDPFWGEIPCEFPRTTAPRMEQIHGSIPFENLIFKHLI